MTSVLLFDNHNCLNSETRNERIELFARTLNDVFKQFQSLWNDYKEALDEYKGLKTYSPNVSHGRENLDKNDNASAANPNRNKFSERKAIPIREKKTLDHNSVPDTMKEMRKSFDRQDTDESFQIFSQDFCTQGLEDTFVNQNKPLALQEIQNLTPKRSTSPILSSKKSKPRLSSTKMIDSPNGSQKSIVILNDFINETKSNCKDLCVEPKVPSIVTNVPSMTNAPPSLSHSSMSISKVDTMSTPKRVQKWELSTMYSTDANVMPGSKKKLKQSKIFVRNEKVTDLSNSDDVFPGKFDESRPATTSDNEHNVINSTQENDNYLEESLIQVSPNHEKRVSKMRQIISRKNKSVIALQSKCNTFDDNLECVKDKGMLMNNNEHKEIADTEITLFEPKLASTQYVPLPVCSSRSANETSAMKNKLCLKVTLPTNDFDTYDETLFIENQTPPNNLTPKKIGRQKKLSLPRKANSSVNFEANSKSPLNVRDRENSSELISPMEISLNSSQEMQPVSPLKRITTVNSKSNPFPNKRCTSPTYVYKGSPVRKHAERALLNGWDCHECEKYYKNTGLTGDELQKRKNECSRHRSKFDTRKLSQKGYWDPEFSSSYHSTMWNDE